MFSREVISGHLEGIQEFCDIYQLDYHFNKDEYQEAPCILAKDGHVVVKTVDRSGILICYLPEVITDNQNMWFYENNHFFPNYSIIGGFQIRLSDEEYVVEELHSMNLVMKQVNRGNLLYHKNQGKSK